MMRHRAMVGVSLLAALTAAGCAGHRRQAAASPAQAPAPAASGLEQFMQQVRERQAAVRPDLAPRIEQTDTALAAALRTVEIAPTADNQRAAGEEYLRLRVHDAAYRHFTAALALSPHDPAALDGLARIWRDWNMPQYALGAAYRAAYYAPDSPAPPNTLGTILLQMGLLKDASRAFEKSLELDARGAYALNNLCYVALLQGQPRQAIGRCREALAIAPSLATAHNNLALAFAATGNLADASREFALAAPQMADYNLGVALLATRRFADAARLFDSVAAARPSFALARQRAEEARRRAALEAPPP